MKMKINCDLGESYGAWSMGRDSDVMPFIDQANLACGFHAGDPLVIQKTLTLAKQFNVSVGAHPSYPDLVGFGRRSMRCSARELNALIQYQIGALDGMAKIQGIVLDYVKPHGALYNDMMSDFDIFNTVLMAVHKYPTKLTLMIQATIHNDMYQRQADNLGVKLYFEAFADRCYDDSGHLLSRNKVGAVLSKQDMLLQVKQLANQSIITTHTGKELHIKADSICVHGDNSAAVSAIADIRALLPL
jgi:UPF0271 protein